MLHYREGKPLGVVFVVILIVLQPAFEPHRPFDVGSVQKSLFCLLATVYCKLFHFEATKGIIFPCFQNDRASKLM